jgi:L-fuconolactonase
VGIEDIMFIDSHVHFWRLDRNHPIGINRAIAGLSHDFLPDDLTPQCRPLGVSRVVLVQAAPSLAETRDLLDLARHDDLIAGVVGWVDLEAGDVSGALDSLRDPPKLAGIRALPAEIPVPHWLARPAVRRGLRALAEADLACDLLVGSHQLAESLEVLEAIPDLRANINHCGRPVIVCREWEPWATTMREIAQRTRTVCKLSGLIERGGFQWSVEDLKPYVGHLLSCFGADRLMFASNWPVLNLTGTYRRWWDGIHLVLEGLGISDADRLAIFRGTATRCYRLARSVRE